ncbi:MAG TPA: DUF58 domain-containing protein [Herpetosiphonaceae bacterium]|nr:DUF58 domain-containing protein [Herpetosiphonaceae bacterium]
MNLQDLMRQVRLIELKTTKLVTGMFAGMYMSSFKGRGIEFDEIREYVPGDDVRAIDWNVTARTGKPFIKRFVEEREMTVMVLVDISGSSDFGTQVKLKRELEAELCATLALSAVRNNDRVGLVLFTEETERYLPPRKGRNHVMNIIRTLLTVEPRRRGTNITAALDFVNNVVEGKALVFIVSDFRSNDDWTRPLRITARRHDVVAVRIEDPRETKLPSVGLLRLQDAETGREVLVDLRNKRVRAEFEKRALEQRAAHAAELRVLGVDTITLRTDQRYADALQAFFTNRVRRRERG